MNNKRHQLIVQQVDLYQVINQDNHHKQDILHKDLQLNQIKDNQIQDNLIHKEIMVSLVDTLQVVHQINQINQINHQINLLFNHNVHNLNNQIQVQKNQKRIHFKVCQV